MEKYLHPYRQKPYPAWKYGSIAAMLLAGWIAAPAMAAEHVTAVWGNYNGFWQPVPGDSQSVKAQGQNEMLAFTAGTVTYSTGVNDAALADHGVPFTAAHFQAFVAAPGSITSTAGYNAIPQGSAYDLQKPREAYLSEGVQGLDLNTALFNIPGATLQFPTTITNAEAITDNVPDIVVTQVGKIDPGQSDTFFFTASDGSLVGNQVSAQMHQATAVGAQNWDFYEPATGTTSTLPGLHGPRDLRLRAFHLHDFGIDGNNMAQIAHFNQQLSNQSDVAFVAYNTQALLMPAKLEIHKTANAAEVQHGALITYNVTLSNTGGVAANGVQWTDSADAALAVTRIDTGTKGSGSGSDFGSCTTTVCSGIRIAAGESVSYTVVATAQGSAGTDAINTATVDSGQCAPDCTSSASVSIVVAPPVDPPSSATPVPTLGEWSLLGLTAVLAMLGVTTLRRPEA